MKKKVFILSQWMNIDGVEASLLGLLKELDYSKVEVDLCLQHQIGPWMNEIPKEVNLLPEPVINTRFEGLVRFIWYWGCGIYYRIFRKSHIDFVGGSQVWYALMSLFRVLPKSISDKVYDIALIFGGNPIYARTVNANVKAVWVHDDWATYKPIVWLARRQFARLDYVVNVSDSAKANFDKVARLPSSVKSIVIENILSPMWMLEKSHRFSVDVSGGVRILSVGRVSPQKNYIRALGAAKILAEHGIAFKWLVVGDGELFGALKEAVDKSGLGDTFQLVGKKANPYPYYKWCDMLVCTSDGEGKSVAVREAQMFAKPVIVTKFPTAASQVEDGIDGLLVERTPQAVAEGVERILHDSRLRERLSANCKMRDYANLGEIDKLLSLAKSA